jgi:DNA replication protein DnaC
MGRRKIAKYVFDDQFDVRSRVERILRILECDTVIKALDSILKNAQDTKLSYLDFMESLFELEMQKREDDRIERWKKQARFPWVKGLDKYDFTYPEFINKTEVLRLADCSWIDHGGNVIFFGPPGVGKTHLSIAIGLEAISRGCETRFITIDRLTEMISVAMGKDKEDGGGDNRKKLLSSFSNVKLLILDELAYSKNGQEVADFLFQLLCRRHEQRTSTILTSNEGFESWNKFFAGNDTRTMAIIDRILENCTVINIQGESFRLGNMRLSLSKSKSKIF